MPNANERARIKSDSAPDFFEGILHEFHEAIAKIFPNDQNLNDKFYLSDGLIHDVFPSLLVEIEEGGHPDAALKELLSMSEKELHDKLDNLLYKVILRKFYDRNNARNQPPERK